jgi:hypothetical protein
MIGYTVEKFRKLLPYFEEAHDAYLSEYRMDSKRRRGLQVYTVYADSPLPCMQIRHLTGEFMTQKQMIQLAAFPGILHRHRTPVIRDTVREVLPLFSRLKNQRERS